MEFSDGVPVCEYCGTRMKKFAFPPDAGYGEDPHFVCFNDDCSYFIRGWSWMLQQYQAKSSYRNRFDPAAGIFQPIPVWSKDALKDRIVD